MPFDYALEMDDGIPRSAPIMIPTFRETKKSPQSSAELPRKRLAAQDMRSLNKFENQAKLELALMNTDDWELDALTKMCVDNCGRFIREGPVGHSPFIYKRWVAQQEKARQIKMQQDAYVNNEEYDTPFFDLMPKEDEKNIDSMKQDRGRTGKSRAQGNWNNPVRTPPGFARVQQLSEPMEERFQKWMIMAADRLQETKVRTPPGFSRKQQLAEPVEERMSKWTAMAANNPQKQPAETTVQTSPGFSRNQQLSEDAETRFKKWMKMAADSPQETTVPGLPSPPPSPPRKLRIQQRSETEEACFDAWMAMAMEADNEQERGLPTPPPTPPRPTRSKNPTKNQTRKMEAITQKPQQIESRTTRASARSIQESSTEAARTRTMMEKVLDMIGGKKKVVGAKERWGRVQFVV